MLSACSERQGRGNRNAVPGRAATIAIIFRRCRIDRRVHADTIAQQSGVSWRSIERAFAMAFWLAQRQFVPA
jgi:hypothetical protein